MIFLIKFFQVAAILFLAFFWNKYILKKLQNLIINDNNKELDDSFFAVFSPKNQATVIKVAQCFYWLVAIIVAFLLAIQ